ncbi:MAG: type II toxin-antitoxin system PemK/MazF family toxin [Acidimicrobiales bacterium]
MNRGEVYLADLEPARGAEADKWRPVILVGNDASLRAADRLGLGVVSVVPCTSNTSVRGPMQVLLRPNRLNGLTVLSKAQTEQIRSIDVSRLRQPLGRLGAADADAVDAALRYHLALS